MVYVKKFTRVEAKSSDREKHTEDMCNARRMSSVVYNENAGRTYQGYHSTNKASVVTNQPINNEKGTETKSRGSTTLARMAKIWG